MTAGQEEIMNKTSQSGVSGFRQKATSDNQVYAIWRQSLRTYLGMWGFKID